MNDTQQSYDAGSHRTAHSPSSPAVGWTTILRLMWDRYPWLTIAMAITGVLAGLTSVAVIGTLNTAIHDPASRQHLLLNFIGLNVASIALKSCAALLPAYASMKIITELRVALCARILATPLEEIDRRGAPNVLTLLANDIPVLSQTLLLLPTILSEMAVFIFGFAYLAYLSWAAFALTIGTIVLGVLIHSFFLRRAMSFSRQARDEVTTFNEHTYSLVFGVKELKLNGARRSWFRREGIESSSRRVARFTFIEQLWFAGGGNLGPLVFAVLLGVLVFAAPQLQLFEAATLTACILVILYLVGPISMLVSVLPQLGHGVVACERLVAFGFSISDRSTQVSGHERILNGEQPVVHDWANIELRGVRTDYHDYESATSFELGPLNLRIHPGELIFIVGGNGSGKSTLARILTGLYTPRTGQILLDGRAVDEDSKDAYRSLFSAVFTDFHLFNQILGAAPQKTVGTLAQEYLLKLRLADKVHIANDKYSTTTALSNGQRKRLALICAYLEDRPIYVLDEWAADQDPTFKKFFYEVLLPDLRSRGKCVVVITHDDQYFELADRIVKLSDGQIVASTPLPAGRLKPAPNVASAELR